MKTLQGVAASSGLAVGAACLYAEKGEEGISHYSIDKSRVDGEILRLEEAVKRARATMARMVEAAKKAPDKRAADIFRAHLLILEDPVLYEKATQRIRNKLVNAEHAAGDAFEEYIRYYETGELHFAELSHDIKDVKERLLAAFSGISGHFECPAGERQPVVIVSRRLTPAMVMGIPRGNALAFVTEEGGFTTHATILAKSYGVPVIFGVNVEEHMSCGDSVIVDGSQGKVIVAPDETTLKRYFSLLATHRQRKAVCEIRKVEPSRTGKGLRVTLKANISLPGEIELLKDLHYDGIGLLRTEFLFMNKLKPPSEDEQFRMYRHVVEGSGGRPVSVRLLDIGGDKLPPYLSLPEQENPDLGIRGARALDFFRDVYITQVKAILRASAYGGVRLLYPMVSDSNDVKSFSELVAQARAFLKKEKVRFNKKIKAGIMIETPAAAVMADLLLKDVDFANIGSNDLLQYTLAASRGNPVVERRYHILHPALARLMEIAAKAGKDHGKEICLCGEVAGFEHFYSLFLSLGLRSFSVAASKLADIKCELLHQNKIDKALLKKFYKVTGKEDVDALLFQK